MQLLMVNVRPTGRARYNSLVALAKVSFGKGYTVRDVVNDLQGVQQTANRLKEDTIDDEILQGALLTIMEPQPGFQHIVAELSKVSNASTIRSSHR